MAAADPKRRAENARIASLHSWARTPDRSARTRPGTEAAWRRFETEVDPDGELDEATRAKNAAALRSAAARRAARKRWDAYRREKAARGAA